MTTHDRDLTALLAADLADPTNRAVLADALEDADRDFEANLCRRNTTETLVCVVDGCVVQSMRLQEYANTREHVVLFWVGVGRPAGDHLALGSPTLDDPPQEWLDCEGYLDAEGDWCWLGEEEIRDYNRNTVSRMVAYSDQNRWDAIHDE